MKPFIGLKQWKYLCIQHLVQHIPPNTPKIDKFIRELVEDAYWHTVASQVRQPNTNFHIDPHVLLLQLTTTNSAIQIVVTTPLLQCTPDLANYLQIAGHPKQSGLYDTLWRKFFWLQIASDAYRRVDQCCNCACNQNCNWRKYPLQLFLPFRISRFCDQRYSWLVSKDCM